jgi:hypothetical protein
MRSSLATGEVRRILLAAAGRGFVAGLLGATAMTAGEKLEQAMTRRPASYVPVRTLLTLLGRRPSDQDRPTVWNYLMHFGTAAGVGTLRGVWAAVGLRGLRANVAHTVVRLAVDQTLENVTGVGAPPHTWPVQEQAIDFLHKAVYSMTTGVLVDRLIAPRLESRRGTTSH